MEDMMMESGHETYCKLLQDCTIVAHYVVPSTPEQNGVAER